jgi:two-component system, cell cycle sensor histidine kinase and response regulator CckA
MPHDDVTVLPLGFVPLVLVVDDERTPRAIVTRMVRSLGYRALGCENGRAALRYLKTHPGQVRLLLTDVLLPAMDGAELAERAKDLEPSLITALMAPPRDPHVAELLGGYQDLPFVPKPVSFVDLAEKLERLLGIPSGPPAARRSPVPGEPRRRRRPSGSHQS